MYEQSEKIQVEFFFLVYNLFAFDLFSIQFCKENLYLETQKCIQNCIQDCIQNCIQNLQSVSDVKAYTVYRLFTICNYT